MFEFDDKVIHLHRFCVVISKITLVSLSEF